MYGKNPVLARFKAMRKLDVREKSRTCSIQGHAETQCTGKTRTSN